jgi:hypothetical protein
LLIAYGASTATTLLPCLSALFDPKIVSPRFTNAEFASLLASYIPFLLIPLGIAVDMSLRIVKVLGREQARKAV